MDKLIDVEEKDYLKNELRKLNSQLHIIRQEENQFIVCISAAYLEQF